MQPFLLQEQSSKDMVDMVKVKKRDGRIEEF